MQLRILISKTAPPRGALPAVIVAVVRLDDAMNDRQAQARAGFLGREKRIENPVQHRRRNSRPGVADRKAETDYPHAPRRPGDLDRAGSPTASMALISRFNIACPISSGSTRTGIGRGPDDAGSRTPRCNAVRRRNSTA